VLGVCVTRNRKISCMHSNKYQ